MRINAETRFKYIELGQEQKQYAEESTIKGRELEFDEIAEKSKSIFEEKEITEVDKLKIIRDRISKWSNSIPFHDLTDFGDKIDFVSVIEKPCYIVILNTQYEKRELKKGERPYRGEKIPPKLIDENNVNIWEFNTSLVEDFKEKEESYIITASQEVSKCFNCHGRGEVVCDSCDGSRFETCSHCSGCGEVKCSSCGGRGEHRCRSCGGTGQKEKTKYDYRTSSSRTIYEHCSSCGGRGYIPCTSCRNGYRNCNYCGGRGQVTCWTCRGRGMLTCDICNGEGEVVSYLYFNDIFKPITKTEIINHPDLPKDIISGESIHIYHEEKDTIKKTVKEQEGTIVLEIIQKTIPENILETLPHISVKTAVLQLISSSREAKKIGIMGKDCRILKQKLTINQINVISVVYKYLNKLYFIWLYGKENELLFAPASPISEVCDNYYVSSQDLFKKKAYSQALDIIEKVILMNPKREDAKKLKKNIINKIHHQYVIGGICGGVISGSIIGLLLNFKIKLPYSLYKTGIIFISPLYIFKIKLPYSLYETLGDSTINGVIIGLIIGLIFRLVFSIKIRESKKRFLYPFWVSIIVTILSGVGFYFLK